MLCEPSKDNGWSCLVLKDGSWKKVGEYEEVEIKGNTYLPIVGGKVRFARDTCKVVEERGGKKLVCKTKKDDKSNL